MRNDDQQGAAGDEPGVGGRPSAPIDPNRSPAPTPLLILASNEDLVCVDDVCLPVEAEAEDRGNSRPASRPENRAGAAAETRP